MYDIEKLKKLREERKLSRKEIANLLGISESYYSKIENGKKRLFYDMAIKIADIFKTKPDNIFYIKQ